LGAANGAGIASGNIWIIGATSAVQGAGNKFTGQDFKFDSDQIWKEGLNKIGLESSASKYLGNGLANFSSSFITNAGYYKFITDNLD
jgi:hypothetical protein